MAYVNNALEHLSFLFSKWKWDDWHHECQKQIDSTDEIFARKWLFEVLQYFEQYPDMNWDKRQSGLVLFQAGLIYRDQLEIGAAALLNEFAEAQ